MFDLDVHRQHQFKIREETPAPSPQKNPIEEFDLEAVIAMARLQKGLKNSEESLQFYELAYEAEPSFAHLQEWAQALSDFGCDDQALQLYFAAIAKLALGRDELFEVYKNLGNIFLRMQDLDSAEENYNKAYAINSEADSLLVNIGALEMQRSNFDKAAGRFRDAILKNRKSDKAWIGLALAHRQFGDFELSWANLVEALELNFANETALRLLVDWAYRDGKLQLAVDFVERAMKQNAKPAVLQLLLAQLLFDLGNFEAAARWAQSALNLDPTILGARELLEQVDRRLDVLRG